MAKNNALIVIFFILAGSAVYSFDALYAQPEQFKAIKALEKKELNDSKDVIVRPKAEYKAGYLRDPFLGITIQENASVESAVKDTPPPDLTVQGIIWGGRFPQAIINSKVLREGDELQGARVTSIGKEGVTVFYGGKSFTLRSPAMAGSASNN